MSSDFEIKCIGCGKKPHEIYEYRSIAEDDNMTAEEVVKSDEGTYNFANGHFYCTDCYIAAGMPLGVAP